MNWIFSWLGARGTEFVSAVGSPSSVGLSDRVLWLILFALVSVAVGIWIGQLTLPREALYPKERFKLSLAWSLVFFAFLVCLILGMGWWRGSESSFSAMVPHIVALAFSISIPLLLLPAKAP